jgi:GTP cyclohydrolase I
MGKKYYEIELPSTCPVDAITRWQKAIAEMVAGYDEDPELDVIFDLPHDEIVISRGLGFNSLCEHHLFPFFGTVDIAYLPEEGIVGLSKLARAVDVYSKRFQTQERMTAEIATAIEEKLKPQGVAVIVRGVHTCQKCRGIKKDGEMITSVMRGVFREKEAARSELLNLLKL